jgi:hypothetical protein
LNKFEFVNFKFESVSFLLPLSPGRTAHNGRSWAHFFPYRAIPCSVSPPFNRPCSRHATRPAVAPAAPGSWSPSPLLRSPAARAQLLLLHLVHAKPASTLSLLFFSKASTERPHRFLFLVQRNALPLPLTSSCLFVHSVTPQPPRAWRSLLLADP